MAVRLREGLSLRVILGRQLVSYLVDSVSLQVAECVLNRLRDALYVAFQGAQASLDSLTVAWFESRLPLFPVVTRDALPIARIALRSGTITPRLFEFAVLASWILV